MNRLYGATCVSPFKNKETIVMQETTKRCYKRLDNFTENIEVEY